MNHAEMMHRCIALAHRGQGNVGNGALVGSVLSRNGKILAEGWHAALGGLHAEAALLQSYKGIIQPEDVLYVNLEPCCHHGMQPPCTEAILKCGIKTVVFGMQDPDPRVQGKGLAILRAAGMQVRGPIERARCEYLNKGFISLRTKGRPWVTIKMASTRAGSISKPDGSPLKITNHEQDVWSHNYLRAHLDAILIGFNTVNTDNPILNTRFVQMQKKKGISKMNKKFDKYQPYRIIFDSHTRAEVESKIFTIDPQKTILVIAPTVTDAERGKLEDLRKRGVHIVTVAYENDQFVWDDLWRVLTIPQVDNGFPGISSILVEGGPKTWDSFRRANMMDEEVQLRGSIV